VDEARMSPLFSLRALALCAAASIAPVAADEAIEAASVAIQGRQANLRDLGAAYKGVTDELKKTQPSLALIRQYAAQIHDLAQQQGFWYPPGSGPESEIETEAKAEIWTRPKEFSKAAELMTRQAAKLQQVAAGSDAAAIKAQHQALGKACKQCHDVFREE
jgi:cytochrome c556